MTRETGFLRLFFDGDCPLCKREVRFLQRLDRHQRLEFVDISAEGFSASAHGKTQDALMARMHARKPDGTWVDGVEVFRLAWMAIGLGWFVAPTRLPGISQILDRLYAWFARNRLRITGRCATCIPERSTVEGSQ